MGFKDIGKILADELYSSWVQCGPQQSGTMFFPKVEQKISGHIPEEVSHVIPDVTFHPEVYVLIDFTHQFVTAVNPTEEKKAKRLVDPRILQAKAVELAKFYSYYFDYVLSYGKDSTDNFYKKLIESIYRSEEEANVFLNYFINSFVTSINIERSLKDIGSCAITLRDNPNYKGNKKYNIFFDKAKSIINQLFSPLLPVMVWAKGRFYKDWYFPIFDGYIIAPQFENQAGFTSMTLNCKDTLELARTSFEMINPNILLVEELKKITSFNFFSQPFYGLDHMAIFHLMFHGGAVITDPRDINRSVVLDPRSASYREVARKQFKSTNKAFTALGNFIPALEDGSFGGILPENVADTKVVDRDSFTLRNILKLVSHTTRPRYTSTWGYNITPYRLWGIQAPGLYTAEFSNRLDVLTDSAALTYYEFYVDGFGTIHYHPMRMSNQYLLYDIMYIVGGNERKHKQLFPGSQIVGPEETLNSNTIFNVEELTTFLRLTGVHSILKNNEFVNKILLAGSASDPVLMRKYGYRRKDISNPMFNANPNWNGKSEDLKTFMKVAAKELMTYMNGELYTRTSTIIFRPEFEIGLPVFFTDDNNVFYVRSLSHSINIGGDATTTFNANFGRKDKEPPFDLMNLILDSEKLKNMVGSSISLEALFEGTSNNFLNPIDVDQIEAVTLEQKFEKLVESESKEILEKGVKNIVGKLGFSKW